MNSKIKILFILPSLHPGGAERVVSFVAQNINKDLFDPHLLILYTSHETDYQIKGIPCRYLNKDRSLFAIPGIIKMINRLKPNIVFTSISQLNFLSGFLSKIYPQIKFIGREASVFSHRKKYNSGNGINISLLTPFAYRSLSSIVCQSFDMAADIKDSLGIEDRNIRIIGNPVTNTKHKKIQRPIGTPVRFISVGRLTEVKGYDRVLKVLANLDFDFTFTLIGQGEDLEKIMDKARDLKVSDKINHVPYTSEVGEYLVQADLFLQGSFVEGFPNALLESCSVGVPAIAFSCPGGTKEIIQEGVNGYLAENEEDFIRRIYQAVYEKDWCVEKIIASIANKFNSKIITAKYEELFQENR